MKQLLSLFALLTLSFFANAQCYYSSFHSQNDIDSFFILHPTCTSIMGDIFVTGQAITNLHGFQNLTALYGNIYIDNTQIQDLQGFEQLNHIGILHLSNNNQLTSLGALANLNYLGALSVEDNALLPNFEGLDNLTHLNTIYLIGNPQLTSWQGLHNLTSASYLTIESSAFTSLVQLANLTSLDSLKLEDNGNLTNLQGLGGITSLAKLSILDCDGLTSLTGLDNLTYIGRTTTPFRQFGLYIEDNDNLLTLQGLESLDTIFGNLKIYSNWHLQTLQGLENLKLIEKSFKIELNRELTTLEHLQNITAIHSDTIGIFLNRELTFCAVPALCMAIPEATRVAISNNAGSCLNITAMATACADIVSSGRGTVYYDLNCNGQIEAEDGILPRQLLRFTGSQQPFAYTHTAGEYVRLMLPNTTYTFGITFDGFTTYPAERTLTTDAIIQAYDGLDFRVCPNTPQHDLSVTLTGGTSPPRPGFHHDYLLCYTNQGTFTENASLTFSFPNTAQTAYISNIIALGGIVNSNTVTWALDNIPLFAQACFPIWVELNPTAPLDSLLTAQATIVLNGGVSDVTPDDNTATLSQVIVGSFDPNDKTVNLTTLPPTTGSTKLNYHIRFQNTGTFPATFVEVIDTIADNLDLRTFEMVSASHPYQLTFREGNIVKWRFDNINLPDSTSNEPESHGFVNFNIATQANLPLGEQVKNSAAIYFDYNAPVITNTAMTDIVTAVREVGQTPLQLSIYPNPMSAEGNILLYTENAGVGELRIFDPKGSLISTNTVWLNGGNQQLSLTANGLPAGVYSVQIVSPQGVGTAKWVVKR